jgi:plasmid segregation protein ParM
MAMHILGIDPGNYEVKVVGLQGHDHFSSVIGESRDDMKFINKYNDGMTFDYNGRKGFTGTLSVIESEFSESMKSDSKANPDAKLRVLLAIARFMEKNAGSDFSIVVGQPIKKYEEKDLIKDMLIGPHTITVNDVVRRFTIHKVGVSPEGAAVGLIKPRDGFTRIIDIGSGTVNWGTVYNKRFVDRDSDSEDWGMETVTSRDPEPIARRIGIVTRKKWKESDYVRLVGGPAKLFLEPLRKYYPNIELFTPEYKNFALGTEFVNALAFYEIARGAYGGNNT